MTQFGATISTRIHEIRRELEDARSTGDDYLTHVRLGELESLARLAADHGVAVEGLDETLAAHGLATPAAGVVRVVDLRDDAVRA